MLTKNQIKHINSLKKKKYRHGEGEFVVEGEKCVHELLNSELETRAVYAVEKWVDENSVLIEKKFPDVLKITGDELEKISSFSSPNMVLAVASIPEEDAPSPDIYSDIILALDNIRDPGNMGMIIRTADWFGIRNILCSTESADAYNPKVVQSSMGSLFRVNIFRVDLRAHLEKAPSDIIIYGTRLDGDVVHNKKLPEKGVIIIGNESGGISEDLGTVIKESITIPPFRKESGGGGADSLNAALAAAIICYEFRRQRDFSEE